MARNNVQHTPEKHPNPAGLKVLRHLESSRKLERNEIEKTKKSMLKFVDLQIISTIDQLQKTMNQPYEGPCFYLYSEENDKIIYWESRNPIFIQGLGELIKENKIQVEKCSTRYYSTKINFPLGKENEQYNTPRWCPVILKINQKKVSLTLEDNVNAHIKEGKKLMMKNTIYYGVVNSIKKTNEYYDFCKEHKIPCITASGRKNYDVFMDTRTTLYDISKEGQIEIEYFIRKELFDNPSHLQNKMESFVGNSLLHAKPIRKERLDAFCNCLFFLWNYHKKYFEDN